MKTLNLKRILAIFALLAAVLAIAPAATEAAPRARGMLYHDGQMLRTFAVPARLPHGGTDPLYMVTNGVSGQLGIAGVAPGVPGYSGGDWAAHTVTFNSGVTPYLLTSDEAVEDAESAGDVTVTRVPENDFRCPIQP